MPEQEAVLRLLILLVEASTGAAEQLRHSSQMSRGIPWLAILLHSASGEVCVLACTALQHVVHHKQSHDACMDCLQHDIPQRLTQMLRSGLPHLQLPAARLISKLAKPVGRSRRTLYSQVGQALESLAHVVGADVEVCAAASIAHDAIKPGSFRLARLPSFLQQRRQQVPSELTKHLAFSKRTLPQVAMSPPPCSSDNLEHMQSGVQCHLILAFCIALVCPVMANPNL